jgi:glycosyltransferase involved in cell wall biosynthesis
LRRGLVAALPEVRFSTVTLPPRHYAWRAGGNALALAEVIPRRRYDALLAMGPVDLASLRGLRPDLVDALTVLYLHEHEFAYPSNPRERGRVDRQMRQILALLAADRIRVNSRWCGESLLDGVRRLLARMPDAVPADTLRRIEARLAVEPVPLEDELWEQERPAPACSGERVEIVWNHRHEWDKGPDRLPVILRALHGSGLAFRLHLLGQRFRTRPAAFAEVDDFLAAHPAHRGEGTHIADGERYRAHLLRCDVVLSTALQEFQGLAVMEACALGCLPCVPDRLAYRDWVPENLRAPSVAEDAQRDGEALAVQLLRIAADRGRGFDSLCGALAPLAWSSRVERWRALLAAPMGPGPDQG